MNQSYGVQNKAAHKILLILDGMLSNWKGTERFFYEFGKFLTQNGYEVVMLQNSARKKIKSHIKLEIEPPFKLVTKEFGILLGLTPKLQDIIRDFNPDLIYVNSVNALPFVPMSGITTVFGMHILHNDIKYLPLKFKFKFKLKYLILLIIIKIAWRKSKIVFHALNSSQEIWIKKTTKDRYEVYKVGNPVQFSEKKVIYNKKNEKFKILYFGSWSKSKGFLNFIKILLYINSSKIKDNVEFVIAGGGEMDPKITELSNKFKNITIIRSPNDEEKIEIMSSSDIFIYPSLLDNFPYVLAEAQISGLYSLVSDLPALKEIIIEGKTGAAISLKKGYEERFYNELLKIYELWDKDYDKFIDLRKNIKELSQRFRSEYVLPQLLTMVEKFLPNKNGGI